MRMSASTLEPRPGRREAYPRSTGNATPIDSDEDRPVHVCFMIDRLLRGGTESQLVALIDHLDRARVRPFLCLLDGEDAVSRSLEPRDCPTLRLGVRRLRRLSTVGQALRLA